MTLIEVRGQRSDHVQSCSGEDLGFYSKLDAKISKCFEQQNVGLIHILNAITMATVCGNQQRGREMNRETVYCSKENIYEKERESNPNHGIWGPTGCLRTQPSFTIF